MATAEHIKALVESHAHQDDERFYAVALQVAAQEARLGHAAAAKGIRDVVDRRRQTPASSGFSQLRPELTGLMTEHNPQVHVNQASLATDVAAGLTRILTEQRRRSDLRMHALQPIHRVLLMGPPGTGKTFTASILATELGIPLRVVQLDGVITKFMGETAAKLRLIFDEVQATRAVYLFDEFDALGAERSRDGEVGEIRRILNSFLQMLEMDASDSLLVAATNHAQLLDKALFRRFDMVIRYSLPTPEMAVNLMKNRLATFDTARVDWESVALSVKELSQAELAKVADLAAKNAVLSGKLVITTEALLRSLKERQAAHGGKGE